MTKYKITGISSYFENYLVTINGEQYFMSHDKLAEVLKQLPPIEGTIKKKITRTWFE